MPARRSFLAEIDHDELAAILAGLRLLQTTPALPAGIEEIATDGGQVHRLDAGRIDALCEHLNGAPECPTGARPWDDGTGDPAAEPLEEKTP